MSLEWAIPTMFFLAPLFFMILLTDSDEDDGPPDGGLMQPVYAPSPS